MIVSASYRTDIPAFYGDWFLGRLEAKRKAGAQHPMEEVGARLRALMPWLEDDRLVDRTKN